MKHKQEPFEPTVGLTQVGVLHGELPNVLGDYDQQTMVDVMDWASDNVVSCGLVFKHHTKPNSWFCGTRKGEIMAPTLYSALLAAWKARGEK